MKRTAVVGLCAACVLGATGVAYGWPGKRPGAPHALVPMLAQQAPGVGAAAPQPSSRIEVLVLEGSNGPGGIAAGLEGLPQLRRPPFNTYSQIALVSRSTQPLGNQPSTVSLPGGGSAEITLTNRAPNGRAAINVQITTGGRTHNLQFAATVNAPFFTVVSSANNRALILGFIVR